MTTLEKAELYAKTERPEELGRLFDEGVPPDSDHLLYWAANRGCPRVVDLLLARGVDPNAANQSASVLLSKGMILSSFLL